MAKKYDKSHKAAQSDTEANATIKALKFGQMMHENIFNNLKLAIPGRLTWSYPNMTGLTPTPYELTPEGISAGHGICMNNLSMSILFYWEGKSTIEQLRKEALHNGWAGKIDEVIQLCTPTPFLKDVKGSIKMTDVPVLKVTAPEI